MTFVTKSRRRSQCRAVPCRARAGQVSQTTRAQHVAARIAAGFRKTCKEVDDKKGGDSQVVVRSGAYAARALRMAQSLRALYNADTRAPCDCLVAGARRQAPQEPSRARSCMRRADRSRGERLKFAQRNFVVSS